MENKPSKEHWSRHPAFLIVLTVLLANAGAIAAAIKYATVGNIPLFILIWFMGAFLSFIAGFFYPLYIVHALFSKNARDQGYIKYLLQTYPRVPQLIWFIYHDFRELRAKSRTQREAAQKIEKES